MPLACLPTQLSFLFRFEPVHHKTASLLAFLALVCALVAPTRAQAPDVIEVVEYYHADLDHYFITADPSEIATLDAGRGYGWARTQGSFHAYAPSGPTTGVVPVCRFYGLPSAGLDSHFYTASPEECDDTVRKYASSWQKESGNVFRTGVPDALTGDCPADTVPVYRLFNSRADANHRYTTDMFVRAQMMLAGYVPEGYGPNGVVFCGAKASGTGQAKIIATKVSSDTYGFSGSGGSAAAVAMSYEWTFGDGGRASGPTAMRKYASSGTYNVTLTVTDTAGKVSTASTDVAPGTPGSTPPPAAPGAPACTLTSSKPYPTTGTQITLLAQCSGSPVVFKWTNCTSSSNACVTSSSTAGTETYTVVALSSSGNSTPASVSVTWLAPGQQPPTTPPPPTPPPTTPPPTTPPPTTPPTTPSRPSCSISASAAAAVVGSIVTLTAACTDAPTSYSWSNCGSATATCQTTSASPGTQTYSVSASNAAGAGAAVSTQVQWTAAGPPAPPPVLGAPGTWTRYSTSYSAGTEAPGQSWYNLAWDAARQRAYGISWTKTLAAFDPAAGRWTTIRAGSGIQDFHNRTIAYDPQNDRLWVSGGTGSEPNGFQYVDLATSQWHYHCNPSCGEPSYEAAMIYDAANKRLISFGGWHEAGVSTFGLQPVATRWQSAGVSGGPSYGSDVKRMTAWRTVVDSARSRMIFVDTDGSLWALPFSLSGWQRIATSGTPPPSMTQYVYDAANDAIVGWSGSPRIAMGDSPTGTTRETWTLSLSTLTWMRAASAAGGASVPPQAFYVGYAMVYDPVRQQTILHTANNTDDVAQQTWAYRHPGAAAPPPAPPPPVGSVPSCTVAASDTAPTVGGSVTLTATCSNAPTSYAWTNCASATASCVAQSGAAGTVTYLVVASNAAGASPAASVQVAWQAAAPTPPPAPPPGSPGSFTGVITSFPLPSTPDAPYSTQIGSKHTNMASDGRRLYVQGGDWTHSATDGTWSMDLATGTWRKDVDVPIYPTRPAPHALQDGAGFVWVASRQRFLIWPGSYYAYEGAGDPILNYAKGMWWFDPATNTYTQELGLFGCYLCGTGNIFGGVYDEVNDHIVAFGDTDEGYKAKRWHVGSLTRLPDVWFNLQDPPNRASYFKNAQHVKIGRYVYVLGIRTGGSVSSQQPVFFRWHLDNRTVEELAVPPASGSQMIDIEIRLAASHGKVVWPFMRGPEGNILGLYVYDPAQNRWFEDTQRPSYGNFIGNSVTSLPDGRVVWSGGVFGRQQTHVWFYEAR
jgi:hypothetical protein